MGHDPGDAWMCGCMVALEARLHDFRNQEIVNVVWALAKMGRHPGETPGGWGRGGVGLKY